MENETNTSQANYNYVTGHALVGHSLEGMRIHCGRFFGVVRGGVCSECHKKVQVVEDG